MLVKKSFLLRALLVVVLKFVGFSLVFAGDPMPAPPNLDTKYEANLLKSNNKYPDVELRKEFTPNCSCEGGYFGFGGGYSFGEELPLVRAIPIVTNPGAFNEALLGMSISGKQYTASLTAGYKLANLRAEVSGEYKRFSSLPEAVIISGVAVNVSNKTEQFGALMSGYYDFDIKNVPITPYLGLGAGLTNATSSYEIEHTVGGTTTTGALNYSKGIGITGAAMAGIALQVTDNIILDIGYRYTNAFEGDAQFVSSVNRVAINTSTGVTMINAGMGVDATVTPNITERLYYPNLISHEVKIGMRYRF